ncbi:MAG: hypothetical protein KA352_08395 [Flavobacteriales bacterium]|nr:hypothetical protein [Flavobacteriales bacterium]
MDQRIRFESKEESNLRREQAFMALSPSERVEWFFRSFADQGKDPFEVRAVPDNFVVHKKTDAVR